MGLGNLFPQPFLKIAGIVMEVREVQPLKAALPMYVTESGIVMEARELHPPKTPLLISVTESGIVMEAREVQSLKAR